MSIGSSPLSSMFVWKNKNCLQMQVGFSNKARLAIGCGSLQSEPCGRIPGEAKTVDRAVRIRCRIWHLPND